MSNIRICQKKLKNSKEYDSTMEKSKELPEGHKIWVPKTPAKRMPPRLQYVYMKRARKSTSGLSFLARISEASVDNSKEEDDQNSQVIDCLFLGSDRLIDLNKNICDWGDDSFVDSYGSKDSESGPSKAALAVESDFVVDNSGESGDGVFRFEETIDNLGDRKPFSNNVARHMDFGSSGESNYGFDDMKVPSVSNSFSIITPPAFPEFSTPTTQRKDDWFSSPESLNAPNKGALDCITAVSLQVSASQIDRKAPEIDREGNHGFLPGFSLKNVTNILESHASQSDREKDLQGDCISLVENEKLQPMLFEPTTPLLKHNKKRPSNIIDMNLRPLKRSKIKKQRHRPKVVGQDRSKRSVKNSPEKKVKRKDVRKNQSEERKDKKNSVRKFLSEKRGAVNNRKTSTIEHNRGNVNIRHISTIEHNAEIFGAKSSLVSVVTKPNDDNITEIMQPNDSRVPEMMLPTVSSTSERVERQAYNPSKTVFWDLNLEMKTEMQFDVGENVDRKNSLADLDTFRWRNHGTRSVRHCHRDSRKVEPTIPKSCKGRRIKRKRKSRLSIIVGFLHLHGFKKKKRSKRFIRRGNSDSTAVLPECDKLTVPLKSTFHERIVSDALEQVAIDEELGEVNREINVPEISLEIQLFLQQAFGEIEERKDDLMTTPIEQLFINEQLGEENCERNVLRQDDLVTTPLEQLFISEKRGQESCKRNVLGKYDLMTTPLEQLFISEERGQENCERNVLGSCNETEIPLTQQRKLTENCIELSPLCFKLLDGSLAEHKELQPSVKSRGQKKAKKEKGSVNQRRLRYMSTERLTKEFKSLKISDTGAIVPYHDSISNRKPRPKVVPDFETLRLWNQLMKIGDGEAKVGKDQDGAMVPHHGSTSNKKPRPKVVLDSQTLRHWNHLMKIDDGAGEEKVDKEQDKKWEEEINVFLGRLASFTSKMHLILGDRRFKPWKGSVVDSVVGVYLTQNVSDFLSSSAYMSLAAKFPVQSTSEQEASDDNLENNNSQETVGTNIVCNGTTQDSHGMHYFVAEPEPETEIPAVTVEEISLKDVEDVRNIFPRKCNGNKSEVLPENASGETESTNSISNSKRLNGIQASSVSISPSGIYASFGSCCFSTACPESNNSELMEDYQAEKVIEENVSPCMCSQPAECSSQEEVGTEINLDSQSVLNDKQLNILHLVQMNDSFLNSADAATSMENSRHGLALALAVERRKITEGKKIAAKEKEVIKRDWDGYKREYSRPRTKDQTDSVDWEAVRRAPLTEIVEAIKARGQYTIIAKRIQDLLNRIVEYHGEIDLEWLRYAPPDIVTEYLLDIPGLGLKSTECIRLLQLHHKAFPVDTNVARIAVRLGWVPLEPLPGDLQFHLLEEYPVMDSIQKYLWPRLDRLTPSQLYLLHYQLITFGKVFCTKRNPNCGTCPMRAECRHLASAIASTNISLPGPSKKVEERSMVPSTSMGTSVVPSIPAGNFLSESNKKLECGPIIEEPNSPELERDIEDFGIGEDIIDDEEEIPTIKLNKESFKENVQYFMDKYETDHSSRSLVSVSVNVDSAPMRKLKHTNRLRTEHQVYELPDNHELLRGLEKRERDDPLSYLLAIWTAGETPESCHPPEKKCKSQGPELCNDETCYSCRSILEEREDIVRGTILIPCRTAMRARFPLNGTYFQVNEVFADHESSYKPIIVPRSSIWYLKRRTVYIGTSPSAIFRGCSMRDIQENFWKGFICLRGWDPKTRAPKPLSKRFHCPPSKMEKTTKRVNKNARHDAKATASMYQNVD